MNSWQDALEITAPGAGRSAGFNGLADSAQLNRLGAPRLMVGATPAVDYRNIGNVVYFGYGTTHFQSIAARGRPADGAEVFLVAGVPSGSIVIERGASINTVGRGAPGFDSSTGFRPRQRGGGVQRLDQPAAARCRPAARRRGRHPHRRLRSHACAGEAQLYSEGTIAFATNKAFELDNAARYGARCLTLAVGSVNAGSEQALADAAARGGLSSGLTLNQTLLDRLMAGDRQHGAPALEMLTLAVSDSFNFFNNVVLDTLDPATGKSRLRTPC